MSLVNLSLQHGRSLDEARAQLKQSVAQVQQQFGGLIARSQWSDNDNRVLLVGTGFEFELWVDPTHVHLRGDIPLLGRLFGSKLMGGIRGLLERDFQKRLT